MAEPSGAKENIYGQQNWHDDCSFGDCTLLCAEQFAANYVPCERYGRLSRTTDNNFGEFGSVSFQCGYCRPTWVLGNNKWPATAVSNHCSIECNHWRL